MGLGLYLDLVVDYTGEDFEFGCKSTMFVVLSSLDLLCLAATLDMARGKRPGWDEEKAA